MKVVKRRTRSNKGYGLYIVVLRCDRGRRADTGRASTTIALIRPSTALDNSVASGPNDAIDRMDFFLRSLEVLPGIQ
jgi:hypothetical protein